MNEGGGGRCQERGKGICHYVCCLSLYPEGLEVRAFHVWACSVSTADYGALGWPQSAVIPASHRKFGATLSLFLFPLVKICVYMWLVFLPFQ